MNRPMYPPPGGPHAGDHMASVYFIGSQPLRGTSCPVKSAFNFPPILIRSQRRALRWGMTPPTKATVPDGSAPGETAALSVGSPPVWSVFGLGSPPTSWCFRLLRVVHLGTGAFRTGRIVVTSRVECCAGSGKQGMTLCDSSFGSSPARSSDRSAVHESHVD